jgi:hypothetical protein
MPFLNTCFRLNVCYKCGMYLQYTNYCKHSRYESTTYRTCELSTYLSGVCENTRSKSWRLDIQSVYSVATESLQVADLLLLLYAEYSYFSFFYACTAPARIDHRGLVFSIFNLLNSLKGQGHDFRTILKWYGWIDRN